MAAIANTGTSGEALTTFSVQDGATFVAEKVTVEAGGVLTGSGVIDGSVAAEAGVNCAAPTMSRERLFRAAPVMPRAFRRRRSTVTATMC